MIFGSIRTHLGEVFHELARQKGVIIEKRHLMFDHVHMCLSIPPKLAVSNVVGFIKGKSTISIARIFKGKQRNFSGEAFWAIGYFVSTIGLDENMVREYIRNQEKHGVDREQLKLGVYFSSFRVSSNKPPALPEDFIKFLTFIGFICLGTVCISKNVVCFVLIFDLVI